MNDPIVKKVYDLEKRTYEFAREVRLFISRLPKTITSFEDGKQVIRSSGSIGANYIEANESLGEKDFLYRIKICRKEAKETVYWLKLIVVEDVTLNEDRLSLMQEAVELTKIFGSMIVKSDRS